MVRIDIKNMQDRLKIDRSLIRKAVRKTLKKERRTGEVSIVVADNSYVRGLNKRYRSVDSPTDVLAFPMDGGEILGDIVVSADRLEEQALEYREPSRREMARLIIHGVLHLLGYPDATKTERESMRAKQEQILKEVFSEASVSSRRS